MVKLSSIWGGISALACAAWLLSGCALWHTGRGEHAQLDDGGADPDDQGRGDGGDPGRPDSGFHPTLGDGGITPDMDGGLGADSGLDGGPRADAGLDAGEGDDAGDAALDAGIDATLCPELPDEPPLLRGSPDAPLEHAFADGALQGLVDWRGRMFIRVTGLTPGARYAVTLEGPQLLLAVFADDDVYGVASCIGSSSISPDAGLCVVTATASVLDVTVATSSGAATPFELIVREVPDPVGTLEAPSPIAATDLPRVITSSLNPLSYYVITGLTPGEPYAVSLVSSDGARVALATFESDNPEAPAADVQTAQNGAIGTPQGTTLKIATATMPSDGTLTLNIEPAAHDSEGTSAAPVEIAAADLPYAGELGWSYHQFSVPRDPIGESFYAITGLTPGDYAVSVTGAPGGFLRVYDDDATYNTVGCTAAFLNAPELSCSSRITGSTLHVRLTNQGGNGSAIVLNVESASITSHGSESEPYAIALSELPFDGGSQVVAHSYYEITGVTPAQRYLFQITELNGPAYVTIYDSDRLSELGNGLASGIAVTSAVTPSGSSLFVRVATFPQMQAQNLGITYRLDLVEAEAGPPVEQLVLDCDVGHFEAPLSTDGLLTFRIVGLDPLVTYRFEARSRLATSLTVKSTSGEGLCSGYGSGESAARCLASSHDGVVLIEVNGAATGEPVDLSVRRLQGGSQGVAAAPIPVENVPFIGQVASARSSFYRIGGLIEGNTYTLRVGSAQEAVFVQRLDSDDPQYKLEVSPGAPGELQFVATGTSTRIKVTLPPPADFITDILIDVVPE